MAQPTTANGVADLHAMLTAAHVVGPYVLVGHSWGGLIAATYARTYPDDVAGLVLVDPAAEYLQSSLGEQAWQQWMSDIAAIGNRRLPGRGDTDRHWPQWLDAARRLSAGLDATHVTQTAKWPFHRERERPPGGHADLLGDDSAESVLRSA